MRKRNVAEADVENVAHKGAKRMQESWEEFKDKANRPFEDVLEKVTGQDAGETFDGVVGFLKRNRKPLLIGAGLLLAAVVVGRILSSDDVDLGEDLES